MPAPRDVVVAVCPEDFRPALAPWVDYRTGQGYDVRLVSSRGTPEEIRGRIRAAAPAERLKFLVLVGDLPTAMDGEPVVGLDADRCVPAPYAKAKVNIAWGSEPKIPDDAWYADLDDDRLPDVAQGRLTADTPEELAAMVQKILSYERSTDFRPWRRRMNFVAGVGGFGAMADSVIESATRYLLTTNVPADYDVMMTQANWRAVYCPDPRRIDRTTIDRLNDGAMFWTYIGHANPLRLAAMRVPGGRYPLLSTRDAERLQADRGPSIALFLCCYAGAIDSRPDCLAEALVRQPGGPVAAVASSRVAMPYAMAVMCREMMDACFKQRTATLGEAVLTAKRSLVHPAEENETRTMLDSIGSLVSPSKSLADERTEHVTLFNLIGDPCLRLRWPRTVTVAAVPDAADRAKLVVEGDSPIAGRALVELVRPLGQLGFRPPRRTKYPDSPEALDAYELTYQRANDRRISAAELRVGPGPFRAELTPPDDLAGKYLVRVFVEGSAEFASGSTDVRLGEEKG
ncbi:MAG: hypothetical protein JW719_01150 [Pirellulales bacterium]|nr:hypothetical protein [Pirellulales bacterium]